MLTRKFYIFDTTLFYVAHLSAEYGSIGLVSLVAIIKAVSIFEIVDDDFLMFLK